MGAHPRPLLAEAMMPNKKAKDRAANYANLAERRARKAKTQARWRRNADAGSMACPVGDQHHARLADRRHPLGAEVPCGDRFEVTARRLPAGLARRPDVTATRRALDEHRVVNVGFTPESGL
jgi:hypothetical protein